MLMKMMTTTMMIVVITIVIMMIMISMMTLSHDRKIKTLTNIFAFTYSGRPHSVPRVDPK